MQGRISGFFVTLFMALPLAAIPLMSIFGIPQIGSLASSGEETGFLLEDPLAADQSADSWNLDSAPSFGDSGANSAPAFGSAGNSPSTGSGPSESIDAAFAATPGSPATSNTMPQGSSGFNGVSSSSSWDQAIAQLASYGIQDYRLQPGHMSQGFHFACYSRAASPGSNRTVIRFEAEAADPLQAVQKTLKQVIQWHNRDREHLKTVPIL